MKRYWKTKDGKKLLISQMETSHIENCISMLHRYHGGIIKNMYAYESTLQGEVAIDTINDHIDSIEEYGFDDEAEEYIYTFEKVLLQRKLKGAGSHEHRQERD